MQESQFKTKQKKPPTTRKTQTQNQRSPKTTKQAKNPK